MNVTGTQMIFAKEHKNDSGTWYSYSTTVSKKQEDGSWKSDPYEVIFVKDAYGTVLADKTKINITDGFLSFRTYEANGKEHIVSQVIVKAFEVVEGQPVHTEPQGYTALSQDDVPF